MDPEGNSPDGVGMSNDEREALDLATGRAASTHIDPLGRGSFEGRQRRDRVAAERLFEVGDLVGGRYRIIRYLAAGGMGVVFEAEDEEIGGRVALKAIQPGAAVVEDAIERFRREIQLARRVTHANVCRLFDVGHHDRGEGRSEVLFLTMEFLDGETLSSRLRRERALSTSEALPIVRQVVAGLQAAHEAGIIHRDLKAANVMLVPGRTGSRAVVTDFGLSRSVNAEDASLSLTQTGFLIGTPAYIAPEQLEGCPPSPATDIYALGLMLYELVAGCLPFAGSSPFVVAVQRLKDAPSSPRLHVPDLDPRWEHAILRCLEKDPQRRYSSPADLLFDLEGPPIEPPAPAELRSATVPGESFLAAPVPAPVAARKRLPRLIALAAGLCLLAVALWALRTHWSARSPRRVAVLQPEAVGDLAGESTDEVVGDVRIALQRAVLGLEGLRALDASELEEVVGSDVEVARIVAADELLRSAIEASGEEWKVRLQRRDGSDGALLWTDELRIPRGEPRTAAHAIAARVRSGYPDLPLRPGSDLQEVSSADYAQFLHLARTVDSGKAASWREVLRELEELRSQSPRFLDTYLLEARLAFYLYRTTGERDFLAQAFDRLHTARQLSHTDPRPLQREIEYAVAADDLSRARAGADELARIAPGEVELLQARGLVAEAEGSGERAVELLEEAARRRSSWTLLLDLAKLYQRTGRITDARRAFERLIELTPSSAALFGLAEIELLHGDLGRAESLFGELLQREPKTIHYLNNLGVAQLLQGRYQLAAETFRRGLATSPAYLSARLNLGDALQLSGDAAGAREEYLRVVAGIADDTSANTSQLLRLKGQALAHLGRRVEAVQCAQAAIRRVPDDSQSHFAAALIYTVIGDRSAAEVHARRALELGIAPRWFELPFVAPLRSVPDLAPLLRSSEVPEGR